MSVSFGPAFRGTTAQGTITESLSGRLPVLIAIPTTFPRTLTSASGRRNLRHSGIIRHNASAVVGRVAVIGETGRRAQLRRAFVLYPPRTAAETAGSLLRRAVIRQTGGGSDFG